jgi:hypothetical protein
VSDPTVNLQSLLARIDRDLAENARLREETNKFIAEARKLEAERRDHTHWLGTLVVAVATGIGLGIALVLAHFLGWWR